MASLLEMKIKQWWVLVRNISLSLGMASAVAACSIGQPASPASTSQPLAATTVPLPPATTAPVASTVLKLLKVTPDTGQAGDSFTITGTDLHPGDDVAFVWLTVEGNYVTRAGAENVEFLDRKYSDKSISLGTAIVDSNGHLSMKATVPEDYGEIHDIMANVGGIAVAKSGFRILRHVSITPKDGPLGTPITIEVTGLGWRPFESVISIRYDNTPVGIITAVTTRGTAKAVIRASGHSGKHVIDIGHGARSVPYLNNQQSGTAHIPDSRFEFSITSDNIMPPFTLDWPDAARIGKAGDAVPRTTMSGTLAGTDVKATLTPDSGSVLSHIKLHATKLIPGKEVELFWVSARGNRVSQSGWNLVDTSLLKANADASGELNAEVQVPDDLGGWHSIKLVQDNKVATEVPFFIKRSLVEVTPPQVKAGEVFTVHLKGVGWTELDNGVTLVYDNAYAGFACGFNSNGDVTIGMVATGGPGIHLIDLYPMLYQGHGAPPWGYEQPFLTFQQDYPGLALGYNLPAFRLAIDVK